MAISNWENGEKFFFAFFGLNYSRPFGRVWKTLVCQSKKASKLSQNNFFGGKWVRGPSPELLQSKNVKSIYHNFTFYCPIFNPKGSTRGIWGRWWPAGVYGAKLNKRSRPDLIFRWEVAEFSQNWPKVDVLKGFLGSKSPISHMWVSRVPTQLFLLLWPIFYIAAK